MTRQKVHERRLARESALALLYSSDITEQDVDRIIETGSYPADDVELPEYAEMLIMGVAAHRAEIDKTLASTSENWALDRMPVVDRAILRLATYEMMFVDDVPVSVAINEAVELAKAYGGEDDSSRFVNGVLGRISRMMDGAQPDAEEGASEESAPESAEPAADAASADEGLESAADVADEPAASEDVGSDPEDDEVA